MKTNQNRNNQPRNYFYDKIPLTLNTIGDEERRRFISYFSHYALEKISDNERDFHALMDNKTAKRMFRSDYYNHLKYALENGILEALEYRRKTESSEPVTYSKRAGLCKAYSLSKALIEELKEGSYSKNIISSPRYFPKAKGVKMNPAVNVRCNHARPYTDAEKEILAKTRSNYMQVHFTVDEDWQDMFSEVLEEHSLYEFEEALRCIKRLQKGEINVSIGERNGRISSPLILMPRKFRKFVRINGKPLWNIDMKSFHPFLLALFINDQDRRAKYVNFLKENDIYRLFEDANNDRQEIKTKFQIYLASSNERLERESFKGKPKEIYNWFETNFPEINLAKDALFELGRTVQLELQKRESEIFVNTVFRDAEFWMIPAHDGIFTTEEHLKEAELAIKRALESYLGFEVTLKTECLA